MSDSPNGYTSDMGVDPNAESSNGLQAFNTLQKFLEADGWYPQQVDGRHIFRVVFNGKNGDLYCYAQVRVEFEQFVFYAMAPVKAPEDKRLAIAEYITRANYGLRIGNFELDFTDGEVRYKTSFDFEKETLTVNFIQHAIYPAVQTMDHYLPGLMSVIYAGQSPLEAISYIENGSDDSHI